MSKHNGDRQLQLLLPINNKRGATIQSTPIPPSGQNITYNQVIESLRTKGLTKPKASGK